MYLVSAVFLSELSWADRTVGGLLDPAQGKSLARSTHSLKAGFGHRAYGKFLLPALPRNRFHASLQRSCCKIPFTVRRCCLHCVPRSILLGFGCLPRPRSSLAVRGNWGDCRCVWTRHPFEGFAGGVG